MRLVQRDIHIPVGWIETYALFRTYAREIKASCMWLNTSVVEGVPMNPKEHHVATVSWLNIRLKKNLASPC